MGTLSSLDTLSRPILCSIGQVENIILIPEEKKILRGLESFSGDKVSTSGRVASERRIHQTQPENLLSDDSRSISDLFVLLTSHLTSPSLIFFICKALVLIILLPIGVSPICLSMRIMLGSIPDIPNHILLGGSKNLYFKQRREFEKPESCSSGRCGDVLAGKALCTWGSS